MIIFIILFSVNFPVVGGGFALLASTGANLAGLGGPAAAAVGAVTPLHLPGLVTGLMPLVGAAALGFLGRTLSNISHNVCDVCCYYRNNLYEHDVPWPDLLHHS